MSMSTQDIPTVPAPRRLSAQYFKLSDTDFFMLIIMVCVIWVSNTLFESPGLLGSIILTVYVLWPLDWSRRYYSWGEALHSGWIRFALDDVQWEASPQGTARRLRALLRIVHPYPFRVDKLFDIGLVYTVYRKTDSIIIGSPGSDIAGMSAKEAMDRVSGIGEVIRRAPAFEGLDASISFGIRRRPYDISRLDLSDLNNLTPPAYHPPCLNRVMQYGELTSIGQEVFDVAEAMYLSGELTKEELRAMRKYRIRVESRATVEDLGRDVQMVTIITIPRSSRLRSASRGKVVKPLSLIEMDDEQIIRLTSDVLEALEAASVKDPQVYTQQQCEDYLRASWDLMGLKEYRARPQQPADTAPSKSSLPAHHPEYGIYVGKDHAVFNSTGITTVRLDRLPKELPANQAPILFVQSRTDWISIAMVGQSSTGNGEYRALEFISAISDNVLAGIGLRTGAKTRKKQSGLDIRTEELADAEHAEYFNVFMASLEVDPTNLQRARNNMLGAAITFGGHAKPVRGRSRQAMAALTATTGIPLF